MLKVLIVEDDVLISEHLKVMVQSLGHEVLSICPSLKRAMTVLDNSTPDVALLDIRLNGVDEGIEIAQHLNKIAVPFAFLTSFSDKKTLMDAVLQRPLGYVLKPFSKNDISVIFEKITKQLSANFITLGNSQSAEKVYLDDILCIKSDNVYVEVYTEAKKHLFREKLGSIHNELPKNIFYRTHQSYIVNIVKVESVSTQFMKISNMEIPLSRKYRKEFIDRFNSM